METLSALLAICAGNSPVPGEFPSQRPVTRSFDVFFICVCINGRVNNREAGDLRRYRIHYGQLWHHHNVMTQLNWTIISFEAQKSMLQSNQYNTWKQTIKVISLGSEVTTDFGMTRYEYISWYQGNWHRLHFISYSNVAFHLTPIHLNLHCWNHEYCGTVFSPSVSVATVGLPLWLASLIHWGPAFVRVSCHQTDA